MCWGYDRGSASAAYKSWLVNGASSLDVLSSVRDCAAVEALFDIGFHSACDWWVEPVGDACAICGAHHTRRGWFCREEALCFARDSSVDDLRKSTPLGVVSQIVCSCGNGMSRVLSAEEVTR